MSITEDELKKLKELYQQHFGEALTDEQAHELGHRLLTVYSVILKNQ